jgi:prefoldin subunit 4
LTIGECFVNIPREDAITKLEELQEQANDDISNLENQVESIKKELAELKVLLYGKFKNSINLEED